MRAFIYEALRAEHLLFYFFAYALAATPTSYLVARIVHKIDVRSLEGFTHSSLMVWRAWSKKSGFLVFVLDFFKGLIPAAIAISLDVKIEIIALIGLCSVVGHCFSIWIMMKGGRGASTSAGAMMCIFWPASVSGMIVFLISVFLGAKAERASFFAVFFGIICFSIWNENKFAWIGVLAMAVIVLWRHKKYVFPPSPT